MVGLFSTEGDNMIHINEGYHKYGRDVQQSGDYQVASGVLYIIFGCSVQWRAMMSIIKVIML